MKVNNLPVSSILDAALQAGNADNKNQNITALKDSTDSLSSKTINTADGDKVTLSQEALELLASETQSEDTENGGGVRPPVERTEDAQPLNGGGIRPPERTESIQPLNGGGIRPPDAP